MIQIKTLLVHGEMRVMNGQRFSTLQADLEKAANAALSNLGDAVVGIDVKIQDATKSTAGLGTVIIQYDPEKDDRKKGGK